MIKVWPCQFNPRLVYWETIYILISKIQFSSTCCKATALILAWEECILSSQRKSSKNRSHWLGIFIINLSNNWSITILNTRFQIPVLDLTPPFCWNGMILSTYRWYVICNLTPTHCVLMLIFYQNGEVSVVL